MVSLLSLSLRGFLRCSWILRSISAMCLLSDLGSEQQRGAPVYRAPTTDRPRIEDSPEAMNMAMNMAIEIADLPINQKCFFHCYVSLPEGSYWKIPAIFGCQPYFVDFWDRRMVALNFVCFFCGVLLSLILFLKGHLNKNRF